MLKREAENLTQKMVVFEVNDQGVPIREICRAVEKRLGLEALGGSVNKMRKSVFCFSKFESTLIEKAKLETVLTRYRVSVDRIRYLKRIGDEITHYNSNKLTVPMIHWQIALLEDADYADALLAKENFIRALHTLGMVRTLGSDGIIHVK